MTFRDEGDGDIRAAEIARHGRARSSTTLPPSATPSDLETFGDFRTSATETEGVSLAVALSD